MAKLDLLRKLIREEVRAVFREELAGILKEAIVVNKNQPVITESARPKPTVPPTTLNRSVQRPVAPILSPSNPLNSLLQETAMSMSPEEFGHFNGQTVVKDAPIVESIDEMFASATKSFNLEAVEINAVPDYSAMMAKMNI